MKHTFSVLILLCLTARAFCQDTTGGTRPSIVIPLHKTPATNSNGLQTDLIIYDTMAKMPPLNADDRKLRAAANSKKYRKKSSAKKVARPV